LNLTKFKIKIFFFDSNQKAQGLAELELDYKQNKETEKIEDNTYVDINGDGG